MNDYLRLSIAYDGSFVASELIISVDGKKVSAGRKKHGGFVWSKEGKKLFDALPKREPRPVPAPAPVEAVREEKPVAPVRRKVRGRRREPANEADNK